MKNIICCIFAYEITKGMKSYGPIGLLKAKKQSKELIYHTVSSLKETIGYKNLYILLGFESEKLKKKIEEYKINTSIITNNTYSTTNHGYAFKLVMKSIIEENLDIDGILFVNSNMLIKKIPKYPINQSWVLIEKKSKNKKNTIGCSIIDNKLNYLFYNIGDYDWTEIVYITKKDIQTMITNINMYYDNMFIFEILNTAIEKQNVNFSTLCLDKSNDLIKINGMKDKYKIK
jgi:hypothetical protein